MKTQTFTQDHTSNEVVVETGGCPVIVDKLFGPASVCRVKVVLDLDVEQWVVFREVGHGDDLAPTMEWFEVARFSASDSNA